MKKMDESCECFRHSEEKGGVDALRGGACRMEVWCSASIMVQLTNEWQEVHVWHDYGQEEENP